MHAIREGGLEIDVIHRILTLLPCERNSQDNSSEYTSLYKAICGANGNIEKLSNFESGSGLNSRNTF